MRRREERPPLLAGRPVIFLEGQTSTIAIFSRSRAWLTAMVEV
jgi:hypothetical protein